MKKILSLFMLLLLCIVAVACGAGKTTAPARTTGQTTSQPVQNGTSGGTTASSSTPAGNESTQVLPEFLPAAPEGLTERVRYERGTEGFYIIKEYFDVKGKCLEEHYYAIDGELGVLDCKIVAYNTFDAEGRLIKSEGHYISNPYYAARETVLVIEAIEHEKFDYKVSDEDGNVKLYIKETKNAKGEVTREEYFTKGGRFMRAEEADYRADGTVSAIRGKNVKNELTYESVCDERGNILSTKTYDEAGRVSAKIAVEYYENGVIKALKTTPVGEYGDGVTNVTEFYDDGRLKKHFGDEYRYDKDGKLTQIYYLGDSYTFNKEGYLLEYDGRINGQLGTNMVMKYTYDNMGRLSSCVTQNTKTGAKVTTSYSYAEDGSAIVRQTNVHGITNSITYTDTKGRVIKTEVHNNVSRTSYKTIEYDAYGNVIKICEYEKEALWKEHTYEYNEHGDLVKTESKTYYSARTDTEYTEYEYFENGYVKSIVSHDRWGLSGKTVYYEDGGYTNTAYTLGEESREITYDKYGREIKTIYYNKLYAEITEYEYYPDGTQKKVMVYHDDVLQSGAEYNESGVLVTKRYELDENGALLVTEYKYNNTQVIREDIYRDGVYEGYVIFDYFITNPHLVKSRTKYDANGNKVYYLDSVEYLKTSKEEFYENGKLVSYYHYTFIDINGRLEIDTREELKDGKTTKVDYDYDESGKIIADTTFENGEKVSTASYIYDDNSELRRITTLGTDGKIIEICESDDGSGYDEVYRYEYHANGKLKLKMMWHAVLARPETLAQKTEYNENGAVTLEEWYDRYYALTKKNTYVYLADGRLDYIETEENGTVSKTHCRYGEDGKLLKKETISGGYPTAYTDFIYYENGVLKEEITYDLLKSRQEGVKTYDESGRLIKECGRPSKKAPGTDYVWGDEFTYTYGEDGRVTEKCHKNINQIDLWIERYEYHENGEVSVLKTYWKNKAGEERENDTQYFDENGYEIYNW